MEKNLKLSIDPSGAKRGGELAAKYAKEAGEAARDATTAFAKLSQLIAKTNTALGKATAKANNTGKAFDRLGQKVKKNQKSFKLFTGNVIATRKSFSGLHGAMSGLATMMAGMEILRAADEYTNLANRIAVVAEEGTDVAETMKLIGDVSFESRTSLEGTVDVYSKLLRATEGTGVAQKELLAITQTVSKAASMGATSVTSTNASLLQFGQAMSNNWQASAQEMNSIIEQTPGLAKAMADGLTLTGELGSVGIGNLKRLGEAGLLSTELMMKGLKLAAQGVEKDFEKSTYTMAQGWLQVKNALILVTGESEVLKIVTTKITETFVTLAETLKNNGEMFDKLLKSIISLAAGGGAIAAVWLLAKAIKAARLATIALSVSMAANPIFALAMVITGVSAAMYTYLDLLGKEETARTKIAEAVNGNVEAMNKLNKAEKENAIARLKSQEAQLVQKLSEGDGYEARIKEMMKQRDDLTSKGFSEAANAMTVAIGQDMANRKVYLTGMEGDTKKLLEIRTNLNSLQGGPTKKPAGAPNILEGGTKAEQERAARKAAKESKERMEKIMAHSRMQVEMQNLIKESLDLTANDSMSNYLQKLNGIKDGTKAYGDTVKTVTESVADLTKNAFKGMEDALVNFTKTGKLSFSDMASSIVSDMIRMQIQQSITKPLSGALGKFITTGIDAIVNPSSPTLKHGDAGYGGTGMGRLAKGGGFSGTGMQLFAKGGVPSLGKFSNSVVDAPTKFAAGGSFNNIMGEAGPEAIMPLSRTSSGDLGVQVSGGGGGGPSTIVIPITIPVSNSSEEGTEKTTTQGQNGEPNIEVIITKVVKGALSSGKLDGPMKGRYGVTTRGA